jgi:hypothetical protein
MGEGNLVYLTFFKKKKNFKCENNQNEAVLGKFKFSKRRRFVKGL